MTFDHVKAGLDNGDPYMVRIIGVDKLDLSYLSALNDDEEK